MPTAAAAIIARNAPNRIRKAVSRPAFLPAAVSRLLSICSQRQGEQCLLFNIVGFCRAGSRAGTGRTLDRQHRTVTSEMPQTRKHVIERAHVGRLLLHPNNFCVQVTREFSREFRLRKWIHLLDEGNSDIGNFLLLAFHAEFMADLSSAEQNSTSFLYFCLGTHTKKVSA